MIIIGDVHGLYDQYYEIVKNEKKSIQLGDFGFDQSWNRLLHSNLSPENHRIIAGNHDCHDILHNYPHYLGRYGTLQVDNIAAFFISGGLSIDLVYRVGEWIGNRKRRPTWWANEQLSYKEMRDCLSAYDKAKPDLVLTHSAPAFLKKEMYGNKDPSIMIHYGWGADYCSYTQEFLQHLYEIHQPARWFFGHFHQSWSKKIGATEFQCLNELEFIHL